MPPEGFPPNDKGPCFRKLDDERLPIPKELVPEWAKGQQPSELRLIPLIWRRDLGGLSPTNQLDCWYLWNSDNIPTVEWKLDPRRVIQHKVEDQEILMRLQLLIFDADIKIHKYQHRLNCALLLSSLAARSDDGAGGVWIVPEYDGSISVWANTAFQLYHGPLE
jgi:hypothetical protein